jgi:hypothetical protein
MLTVYLIALGAASIPAVFVLYMVSRMKNLE